MGVEGNNSKLNVSNNQPTFIDNKIPHHYNNISI